MIHCAISESTESGYMQPFQKQVLNISKCGLLKYFGLIS
jgi:hypothetical protein